MIASDEFRTGHLASLLTDATDPEQRRRELESNLAPLVRLALRKGVGLPALVKWVRAAFARISDGAPCCAPDMYTPQITRLLCAALLHEGASIGGARPGASVPAATS